MDTQIKLKTNGLRPSSCNAYLQYNGYDITFFLGKQIYDQSSPIKKYTIYD